MLPVDFNIGWERWGGGGGWVSVKSSSKCLPFKGDGITLFECAVSQGLLAMVVCRFRCMRDFQSKISLYKYHNRAGTNELVSIETVVLHQWESETGDYQSEVEKDKLTTVANFEKLTF